MQTIYAPKGRAGEYSNLAANIYKGCDHACAYCFAPLATHRDREDFQASEVRPRLRVDLAVECLKRQQSGTTGQVLLSFATDPYQWINDYWQDTRFAIKTLHEYGFSVNILTKGGARCLRDADLLGEQDAVGATLTLLDETESREWEPEAASPRERIDTLAVFHSRGVPTWASLEPVIYPAVTLRIIRENQNVVNHFKVGVLNYAGTLPEHLRARVAGTDWHKFARDVTNLLDGLGFNRVYEPMPVRVDERSYYIKKDLSKYL